MRSGMSLATTQIDSAQQSAPEAGIETAAREQQQQEEEEEEGKAANPAPSDVAGLLKGVDMQRLHFTDRGRKTLHQIIELVDSFPSKT
ncbi:hypothetical protein GUITHDRAFT_112365 [Guillardia theta CCMP2712]|uniref:Uncharacterized protein n=1 Tax=Guillardia theta (strain CCMP2712) TaxID=905079 RepID=L1J0J0_GUITC|nr:hypothetical protein GUITHDRAFT_112365 [Guillardia theta CCMP2712]EKX41659.1 hypothetical protein GUITHDRAFT_112365 [Guillardia theta CCMP2712]|eukprot:XP_005828639.1 hypothetical protein GUITHDRAFT_112365 [Guillardia theta CCMP2712]